MYLTVWLDQSRFFSNRVFYFEHGQELILRLSRVMKLDTLTIFCNWCTCIITGQCKFDSGCSITYPISCPGRLEFNILINWVVQPATKFNSVSMLCKRGHAMILLCHYVSTCVQVTKTVYYNHQNSNCQIDV